jgi:3-methylfumaryl-CoA hydratase
VAALSATLDRPPVRPEARLAAAAALALALFPAAAPPSDIGPEGHAKRGGFLPPVPTAAADVGGEPIRVSRAAQVGDALTRVSTIEDVREKTGRTGRLVFVKVRHEIHRGDERERGLVEHHDIVYRDAPAPGDVAPPRTEAPSGASWERQWIPYGCGLLVARLFGADLQRPSHPLRIGVTWTEVEGLPRLGSFTAH